MTIVTYIRARPAGSTKSAASTCKSTSVCATSSTLCRRVYYDGMDTKEVGHRTTSEMALQLALSRHRLIKFVFYFNIYKVNFWLCSSVPAQFIPGRTGAGLLILNGFTFYMKNHQAHGKKQWYCSSRDVHGCRADVITYKGIYYLPSHRTGSMVLIFKDNKYWINNRYQNTINWTCRDRKRLGCNSCVQTTVEGRYIKHKGFHNHDDNYTKYNFND
ncbi:uncharacterized protein LOC106712925 [Papilio machaon]|uniref:uncharacterized protein LOC106712925 n=1 Tax=Papilio machaon TaxID=76193 RepID=UPI001E662AB1|nr:uncharacterized protein LOC106712925 [Papilio machaon]